MKNLMAPLFALTLAACSSNPMVFDLSNISPTTAKPKSEKLNSQAQQISDEAIRGDAQTLQSVQDRLRQLNERGIPQSSYPLAKAQCWLDTARTQYYENDRTGYVQESLTESDRIIRELELDKNANAADVTPLVANSTRLREDLWQQLTALKGQPGTLNCIAKTVACAEVRLVRAGHAEEQTGWRAATPHIGMVEDGLRRAVLEAQQCLPAHPVVAEVAASEVPVKPAHVVIPVPEPVVVKETDTQKPTPVVQERFVLLGDVTFPSDRYQSADILPGGRRRLDELVQHLKNYASIQQLRVVGHADRLGKPAHNNELSTQRAQTVRDYLSAAGIRAENWEVVGQGSSQPVTSNCPNDFPRPAARLCLAADRRVEVTVTGVVR